jgi:phenylalanyl-tRNA synthetase beta chain
LDDVTTEREMQRKNTGAVNAEASTEEIYKIDIPANRYDLLCIEGLCRALNIFREKEQTPHYTLSNPTTLQEIRVEKSVGAVRPHVVGCILRNMTFTQTTYDSFIELQEKLHQNICRKRTLVSIGTHDLDTVKGPFHYVARDPTRFEFAPLGKTERFTGAALMEHLDKNDLNLRKYLHIIRDAPEYPVVLDANQVVLSLPPIINSNHSKITLNTKNVLIEVTATDRTKALVVLDTIAAAFSQYCSSKFTVEPIAIVETDGTRNVTPTWSTPRTCSITTAYANSCLGLTNLDSQTVGRLLTKMGHKVSRTTPELVELLIPPTRSDVLHACDLVEDVAIAYGYNNLVRSTPKTVTVGRQLPVNKISDQLRQEIAQHGYSEVLSLALCSRDDNYRDLNRPDDNLAVVLANPATAENQIIRTSLLVGLLKSIHSNKSANLPIQLFEISDIVVRDTVTDVGAKNSRYLAAVYANRDTSGFEKIHGLLDRVMLALDAAPASGSKPATPSNKLFYRIQPSEDPSFFPGRRADIYVQDRKIGVFGIIHPNVLQAYSIPYPVSALHMDIEMFV